MPAVVFDLITRSQQFERGFDRARKKSTGFQRTMDGVRRAAVGAFAGGAVIAGVKSFVDAATDAREVAEQTDAVLRSTKGAAGLSAQGFADLAASISATVAVDDELIQSGQNVLATFTNIKGDVFKGATAAAVDLAAAMNHGEVTADGLQSANVQLGKALNDPIKGISALTRVGVSFTDQQKAQIEAMVKAGDTAGAQRLILAELSKEFGGSAAAAATSGKQLSVAWGNAQETLGGLLLPAIERGQKLLISIIGVVDRNRTAFAALGIAVAAVTAFVVAMNVATKVSVAVQKAVRGATIAWTAAQWLLNAALTANPIGLVIAAIALLVAGIVIAYKKSETFRKIVDAAFRGVVAAALWLRDKTVATFRAVVSWIDRTVTWVRGLPGRAWSALSGFAAKLRERAREGFAAMLETAKRGWETVKEWAKKLPGSFVRAMGDLGKALADKFSGAVKAVLKFLGISSPSKVFEDIGRQMVAGLARGIASRMKAIPDLFGKLQGMAGAALFGGPQVGAIGGGRIREIVRAVARTYGWDQGGQWIALSNLIAGESGWRNTAQNPTSTAYGLFQFLDSTWASVGAKKTADPYAQTVAGLRYIANRYGSPAAAYGAWLGRSPHWYGSGGIFTRPTIIGVGEAGPEAVVPLSRGGGAIRLHPDSIRALAAELRANPPVLAVRDFHAASNAYAGRLGQRRPYR
jgi:Transglycosylase SLT domain